MEIDRWYTNYHIWWAKGHDNNWLASNAPLKMLASGVLVIGEPAEDALHYFAPHTWDRVRITDLARQAEERH